MRGPHVYVGPTTLLSFGPLWWSTGVYLRATDMGRSQPAGEGFGPYGFVPSSGSESRINWSKDVKTHRPCHWIVVRAPRGLRSRVAAGDVGAACHRVDVARALRARVIPRVEPGTRTHEQLEKALARHHKRVHLDEDEWKQMIRVLERRDRSGAGPCAHVPARDVQRLPGGAPERWIPRHTARCNARRDTRIVRGSVIA
jgi:hypothetical protein